MRCLHLFVLEGGINMDTLELLTNYYSSYDEEGRLLSRHGSVEYLTTMHYIE